MRTSSSFSKLTTLSQTNEGFAKSFDGTKIWYRSVGKGIPIICSNGLGCSTFYFDFFVEYFKKDFQVIIWDYRGHGKSEAPKVAKNHTIHCLVKDLKCVMDHLKIKQAVQVGHSMGAQVILDFYANYPESCISLVSFFGTFGKPMDNLYNSPISKYVFEFIYVFNHLFPRLANLMAKLMVKNPLWFQMGGVFKLLKPYLADKSILKKYVDHISDVDPIFLAKLTRSWQEHSAEEGLPDIKVPTLLCAADDDTFTPAWLSKKMHHLIPQSELFIVKKGSHVALVEQPELLNLRVEKFLKERVLKRTRLATVTKIKSRSQIKSAAS